MVTENTAKEAEEKKLIYHITHNDADAIVEDCFKGYESLRLLCTSSSTDEDVRNLLINNSSTQKDGKLIFPDILLIPDISALGDETITFIENYMEAGANEGKDVKLVWVDHHDASICTSRSRGRVDKRKYVFKICR